MARGSLSQLGRSRYSAGAEKFVLSTFPRALTTLSSMCSRAVRALESSPGLIMMMDKLVAETLVVPFCVIVHYVFGCLRCLLLVMCTYPFAK